MTFLMHMDTFWLKKKFWIFFQNFRFFHLPEAPRRPATAQLEAGYHQKWPQNAENRPCDTLLPTKVRQMWLATREMTFGARKLRKNAKKDRFLVVFGHFPCILGHVHEFAKLTRGPSPPWPR